MSILDGLAARNILAPLMTGVALAALAAVAAVVLI
jgi:hypothetical protein